MGFEKFENRTGSSCFDLKDREGYIEALIRVQTCQKDVILHNLRPNVFLVCLPFHEKNQEGR